MGKGRSGSLPEAYRGREQAYIKHCLLEAYLEKLFLIIGLAAKQLQLKELAYVDCFAGPWGDETESLQSTSIAISLRVLASCRSALIKHGVSVKFRALYVEKDPRAFARLKQYLRERPEDGVEAEALQGDFVDLIPAITEWADRDGFVFFFIDPKAWRPVSVGTLKPLLGRADSEFLINFMYDFANRAVSMTDLKDQIEALLGEPPNVDDLDAPERERTLLRTYRKNLKALVPTQPGWPARCAYVRVLDPQKDRPKYHLVYLTTHPRGLVEFMEASEDLDIVQKRVRAATKQERRQERTGIGQLFDDADHIREDEGHVSLEHVEEYWMRALTDRPRSIGYAEFAQIIEETDWFPGDLQRALGRLMERGLVRNLDAAGKRRTKFVHLDKAERLQRVGGNK